MIWEEFRSQARQDLISCRTLYEKEHDYGNSAYLLQQGLEKFVKAYLFKFDLFQHGGESRKGGSNTATVLPREHAVKNKALWLKKGQCRNKNKNKKGLDHLDEQEDKEGEEQIIFLLDQYNK